MKKKQTPFEGHCPRCGASEAFADPIMCGSTHADGEPLVYWRCEGCGALFSRLSYRDLAKPSEASVSGAACGECHLQPDEVCDICGRSKPAEREASGAP
jgi:uncharacterized Zn finger protein